MDNQLKKNKPGRLTLLGAVIAFAGLAIGVIAFITTGSGAPAATGGGPKAPVLVVIHDVKYRQVITKDDVAVKSFSQADIPPGAMTDPKQLKSGNTVAVFDIPSGMPLSTSMVVKSADLLIGQNAPGFLPIPTGYVAVTLPIGNGVAGYINPGDYVTIIASKGTTTRTVYTQMHILRTSEADPTVAPGSASLAPRAAGSTTGSILVVVVTQCQAELLTWLSNNTTLRYTLESSTDYQGTTPPADPTCATVDAAKGVNSAIINARWPGLGGTTP